MFLTGWQHDRSATKSLDSFVIVAVAQQDHWPQEGHRVGANWRVTPLATSVLWANDRHACSHNAAQDLRSWSSAAAFRLPFEHIICSLARDVILMRFFKYHRGNISRHDKEPIWWLRPTKVRGSFAQCAPRPHAVKPSCIESHPCNPVKADASSLLETFHHFVTSRI